MAVVLREVMVRLRLETGVRWVVKMVRPLRWLMGGARVRVGVGIRRMFPTLVRKLRHGPLCEGPQGPRRRLVGQIASGSAVCDATNLVWTWVCGLGWCLVARVAWSLGRLVALGSEGSRLTPQHLALPVLSYPVPVPVQSLPGAEGQSLTAAVLRCCGAAVLQVCRCWKPSVSRRAWMTLTILDLGFGLFGDQSRGKAAQEPG